MLLDRTVIESRQYIKKRLLAYAVWLMSSVASWAEIHNHVWLGPLQSCVGFSLQHLRFRDPITVFHVCIVSLWSKYIGYNLCVYILAVLKMAGAGVPRAFGQSANTNVTDSSYSTGLDRLWSRSKLVPPKGVPRTKIVSSCGENTAKSGNFRQ